MGDPLAGRPLAGRTALVTGSTRGIGAALAAGLQAAGARVVLHGRTPATVDRAVDRAVAVLADTAEPSPTGVAFDVTDPDAVARGAAAVGPVDILVNNAGVQLRAPVLDLQPAAWSTVIDTNLTSAYLVSRAFAPAMIACGHGKIVNVCSVQTFLARPAIAAYTAAKSGLAGLTRALCAEWAGSGVQVNAVAPGYIDTELTAALVSDPDFDNWVRRRTPAGRWGQVADIVGPVVFLASPAADFVNGQVLAVDGGMTAVV